MELALFDLDHTLLSIDSDYEWTRFLVTKNVLDQAAFERRNDEFFEQYKAGKLKIFEFLDFQLEPLARSSRADLEAWLAEFIEIHIRPNIGQKARALVKHHLENGNLCALATSTNCFVTGPICRELGIPHLIATVAAQKDGQFTGKPRGTPAFREGKISRVDDWLESMGLWLGYFERTWFYSDSHNDLPLMQHVSDPVAVDPDDILRAHANAAGWKILNLNN